MYITNSDPVNNTDQKYTQSLSSFKKLIFIETLEVDKSRGLDQGFPIGLI